MRSLVRPLAAAAIAGAAFAAPSAQAAAINPVCAGTAATVVLCVTYNPAGVPSVNPFGSSIGDCVYVGSPPCTPVSVPVPTVTPGTGSPATISCGGTMGQRLCASIGS